MTLSKAEKELLVEILRKRPSKSRWRQLMTRRDRFADRLAGESGAYIGRIRTMVYQQLMMLAEDADDEQKVAWERVASRESIKAAHRHLRDFIETVQ